jgi:hypothetical protein
MDGQAPQSASTSGEQEGRKRQQSRTGRPGARPAVRNFHFPSESKEALVQNHFFFFFFFFKAPYCARNGGNLAAPLPW